MQEIICIVPRLQETGRHVNSAKLQLLNDMIATKKILTSSHRPTEDIVVLYYEYFRTRICALYYYSVYALFSIIVQRQI